MKIKSLIVAALLIVSATLASFAKDEPTTGIAVVSARGSQVVKVIYKAETAGKVKLTILDAASKLVFSETRNKVEGFILPLNFSGLPSGEYTIQLTDATGTRSEKIDYQPEPLKNAVHISKIDDAGKFLLSISKQGAESVNVKIYDGYNNLVYNVNNQISGDFAQVYVLENYSGACTFEVSGNDGNITTVRF